MNDRQREVNQIRVWMRAVMEAKNWSAEHWARVAGTSPTNITRFLKDAVHIPSTQTIAKLSRACGSMPEIGRHVLSPVPAERAVPMYTPRDAVRVLVLNDPPIHTGKKDITTMQNVSEHAFAVEISSRRMELRGIAPADIVVCEPVAVLSPQPGSVVLYAEEGAERLEIGCFYPPHITHQSSMAPEVVAANDVTIVGVGVEVRRALPLRD